jgi:hypothetical protein
MKFVRWQLHDEKTPRSRVVTEAELESEDIDAWIAGLHKNKAVVLVEEYELDLIRRETYEAPAAVAGLQSAPAEAVVTVGEPNSGL